MLHLKEFKGVLNNTWVQYSVHKFNAEKPHMQIPQKYLKHRDDPSLFLPENFPFASLYFPKISNHYLYKKFITKKNSRCCKRDKTLDVSTGGIIRKRMFCSSMIAIVITNTVINFYFKNMLHSSIIFFSLCSLFID